MILKILLVISCIVVIFSVVMQSGKAAGMSGTISGGAEQLFGREKSKGFDQIFEKLTNISATLFILLSLLIAIFQK